jgi:outer membrane protein OmpA-like peptidoglycan-associated protein
MSLLLVSAALGAPILDTYRPSPSAGTATIDALEAAGGGDVDLAAWSDYGVRPWTVEGAEGIESRVAAGIAVGVHLGGGFLIEAALPMVLAESGIDPETGSLPAATSLASARLRARAMRAVSDHFAVGVALRAETPSLEFPDDEPRLRVGPELVLAAHGRPVFFGISAGAYWGALDLRTGLTAHLGPVVDLYVEGIAAGPADTLGIEGRVGTRVHVGGGVSLEAGGGYGILTTPGIPEARAYGGLRVAPRRPVVATPVQIAAAPPPAPAAAPAPVATVAPPKAASPPPPPVPPPAVMTVASASNVPLLPPTPVVQAPPRVAAPVAVVTPAAPHATLPQPLQLAVSFNGHRFTTSSVALLDSFAEQLQDAPGTRVRLEVHMKPDPAISDDFAETQDRADLIRDAMVARGIAAYRVEAMGFGSGAYGKDLVDVILVE